MVYSQNIIIVKHFYDSNFRKSPWFNKHVPDSDLITRLDSPAVDLVNNAN